MHQPFGLERPNLPW